MLPGVTGYELQYSTDSTYYSTSLTIQTVNSDTIIKNLELNTKYYWRVRTIGGEYKSIFNDIWNFTVKDTMTSAVRNSLITNCRVFPNPATSRINIEQPDQSLKIKSYNIIDLYGRSIKHGELDANSIEVYDIKAGLYIIQIIASNNELISKKIFIE